MDVKLDTNFATNHLVYFSFMERDASAIRQGQNVANASVDPAGLAIARGTLTFQSGGGALSGTQVIWRQQPKIVSYPGSGEPGGRLAFSPDGRYLFAAAGDRQELGLFLLEPSTTLGKIIRIFPDGSIPSDNPYANTAGALPEIWTSGHRNQYGLAFDANGQLWEHEMGPMGGDEFNLILPGLNFGWPKVSYGNNYDGSLIQKPAAGDGFAPSAFTWTPVIAPSDMIFYTGSMFAAWRGDAIITGLQSKGLVRVRVSGSAAVEVQRVDLGARIRSIAQASDGAIWIAEDQPSGRIIRLTPVN